MNIISRARRGHITKSARPADPVPVPGSDLRIGDTIVLAVTGAHTVDHLDRYARTIGDGMRHAHCTDGTCYTVLDRHTYRVLRPAGNASACWVCAPGATGPLCGKCRRLVREVSQREGRLRRAR